MYRVFVLFVAIITLVYSRPLDSSQDAKILKYENVLEENGKYRFAYETSDGTKRQESGKISDNDILTVEGSYSFFDNKGVRHDVAYIADDQGYRILQTKVLSDGNQVGVRIDPTVLDSLIGSGVGG